jgi:hypothetical protein
MSEDTLPQAMNLLREAMTAHKASEELLRSLWDAVFDKCKMHEAQYSAASDTFLTLQRHASKVRKPGASVIRGMVLRGLRLFRFDHPGTSTNPDILDRMIVEAGRWDGATVDILSKIAKIREITSAWKGYEEPKLERESV